MRTFIWCSLMRWPVLLLPALLACETAAYAQYGEQAGTPPANAPMQTRPAFAQQELDQMLAPIALYPDPLLSQTLMASTYPLEVVEAARWSQANPGLNGDDAVRAVQQMDWDPSVKSLVAFPQLLHEMDRNLDWTERLGDAFLAQEQQVMDTVQNLRQKAYAAGNLRTNEQIRVETEGPAIVVEPANPTILYVPYYDPAAVYGTWWWPAYPPVYWAPWPGYSAMPAFAPGFVWGNGIAVSTGFFFGNYDWQRHRIRVLNARNYYYDKAVRDRKNAARNMNAPPGVWRHDPEHRKGLPYRLEVLSKQYGRGAVSPEARHGLRGSGPSSPDDRGERKHREGGRADEGGKRDAQREDGRRGDEERPAVEDADRGQEVRRYRSRGRDSDGGVAH